MSVVDPVTVGQRAGGLGIGQRQRAGGLGMGQRGLGLVAAFLTAVVLASCGGPGTNPTPPTGGGNGGGQQQPPQNNPPVINAITTQGLRQGQPSGLADLAESISVTASVQDDETAIDQLQFAWSAPVGTFTGTGKSVTWQAPAAAATPVDVPITLVVTERYGNSGGPTFEHTVTKIATVSLHNSSREVGDMARQFLVDFSDSNIKDVTSIMRNFSDATPACHSGKVAETNDVSDNRVNYHIDQFSVGQASVTTRFGGICPNRNRRGDACALVDVDWRSTRLTDDPVTGAKKGDKEHVAGVDQVTAIYIPDQKKWGLCESDFIGHLAFGSKFIR